jgi:hypothetical protein
MSKKQDTAKPTPAQLKLLRRAVREKLGIDTALAKKKKPVLTDPDEEMASKGKVARKGYASSVSGNA